MLPFRLFVAVVQLTLFNAIKPYLSEKRRYKLEKAIVFARVMRVAGVAGAAALKKGG